jgi:hypothetical protein
LSRFWPSSAVDRAWQTPEERLQAGWIIGVEGCDLLGTNLARRLIKVAVVASGNDDAGAFRTGTPGGFQADARAAADHDDGLAKQFRFAVGGYGCATHETSVRRQIDVVLISIAAGPG